MAVKYGEKRVAITNVELMDRCVLHVFAPPWILSVVPCISPETKRILSCDPRMTVLLVSGSDK